MRAREHGEEGRFERQEAGRGGGWKSETGEISLRLENMLFILFFFKR